MSSLLQNFVTRAVEEDPQNCTKETCKVSESLYGYRPNQVVSIIFVVVFLISCIAHSIQGLKARAWTFTAGLAIGTLLEAIGTLFA